jgi:hypothetical protein
MSEGFDPDVVADYERVTWSRCADNYIDTFAGITGETVPLLMEAAGIHPGNQVLQIGSGPGHVAELSPILWCTTLPGPRPSFAK